LGKAYDGNTAALGKLGVGLSSAELKAMSFTDVQQKLTDLFGGAAEKNAATFQGRMDRLKVAFDEGVEAIGYRLLPIIEALIKIIIEKVVPALNDPMAVEAVAAEVAAVDTAPVPEVVPDVVPFVLAMVGAV